MSLIERIKSVSRHLIRSETLKPRYRDTSYRLVLRIKRNHEFATMRVKLQAVYRSLESL